MATASAGFLLRETERFIQRLTPKLGGAENAQAWNAHALLRAHGVARAADLHGFLQRFRLFRCFRGVDVVGDVPPDVMTWLKESSVQKVLTDRLKRAKCPTS